MYKRQTGGVRPRLRSLAAVSILLLLVTGVIFGVSFLRQAADGGAFPAMGRTDGASASRPAAVIDPGHGGIDGGAIGVDGSVEKDINLQIACSLRDMLLLFGFEPVMTRETDISLGEGAGSIRAQKREDLRRRVEIMDEDTARPAVMIHQNTFSDPAYSGAQMFYGSGNAASKSLAGAVRESVVSLLQPDNARELKPAPQDVWMLREAKAPVVMAECGFLSNPDECEKLCSPDYQGQMAFAVAAGLAAWDGWETRP